jgi:hypothetical protein
MFTRTKSLQWYRFCAELENCDLFSLCHDFEKLSLNESESISPKKCESSSRDVLSSYEKLKYNELVNTFNDKLWGKALMSQLRMPFMSIPRHFIVHSLQPAILGLSKLFPPHDMHDLKVALGFRFLPGQSSFLNHELNLATNTLKKFSILGNKICSSLYKVQISHEEMSGYSSACTGMRSLIHKCEKILIEVMTYYKGRHGRFIILATLGVGYTIWYAFQSGHPNYIPTVGAFAPIFSYDSIFHNVLNLPGFNQLNYIEVKEIKNSVNTACNTPPLNDITIPASGPVLAAVSLGC